AEFWILVLIAGMLWFTRPMIPLPLNAVRNGLITVGYFLAALIHASAVVQAAGGRETYWTGWINGITPLIYYAAWALFMTTDGEITQPPDAPSKKPDSALSGAIDPGRAQPRGI